MQDLMIHCGAEHVDAKALELIPVPEATNSYQPVAHVDFVNNVRFVLNENGYQVAKESHALTRGGNRYFGTIELANSAASADFGWIVGLRNSHDKSFPVGLAVGSKVFVCDNLSFSGEITVARKHTTRVLRDLPRLVTNMVAQLHDSFQKQEQQFDTYKATELNRGQVNDILIRSIESDVIPSQSVLHVIKEWKSPRYAEFEGRTAWSLFNGFTEVMKQYSEFSLPKRTRALHHVLDSFIKFGNN